MLEFQFYFRMYYLVYIDSEVVDFVNFDCYFLFMFSDFNLLINLGVNEVVEWDLDVCCYGELIYFFCVFFVVCRRFILNYQVSVVCWVYVME